MKDLIDALRGAVKQMEADAVRLDNAFGFCRGLEELEQDVMLPAALINGRAVLAKYAQEAVPA